jgi:hypothetical protein
MCRLAVGYFHLPIWWIWGNRKLTTHLYLMPRLRRHGTLLPLLHITSWLEERQKMDKILIFMGII